MDLQEMQIPHDPYVKLSNAVPEKCFLFKSANQPIKMVFQGKKFSEEWKKGDNLPEISSVSAIFKNGDDIRQD